MKLPVSATFRDSARITADSFLATPSGSVGLPGMGGRKPIVDSRVFQKRDVCESG